MKRIVSVLVALCLCALGMMNALALEASDAEEYYYIGSDYYDAGDYESAFEWLNMAAQFHIAEAEFLLGDMYLYGFGVTEDHAQAAYWILRALSQDDSQSYAPGRFFFLGGTDEEYPEVVEETLIEMAQQGYVYAQYLLGWVYEYGIGGVSENISQAIYWYTEAADGYYQPAYEALSDLGVGYDGYDDYDYDYDYDDYDYDDYDFNYNYADGYEEGYYDGCYDRDCGSEYCESCSEDGDYYIGYTNGYYDGYYGDGDLYD